MSITHTRTTPRDEFDALTSHKLTSITTLEQLARETTNDLRKLRNTKQVQRQVLKAMSLAYIDQQTEEKLLQKISEMENKKDLLTFYDGPSELLTKEIDELKSNWKELDNLKSIKQEELKLLADVVSERYRSCDRRKAEVDKLIEEGEQLEREFEQLINEDNEDRELFELAVQADSIDLDPSQINSQVKQDVDEDLKRVTDEINQKGSEIENEKNNITTIQQLLQSKKRHLAKLPTDDNANDPVKNFYYFLMKLNELLEILKE